MKIILYVLESLRPDHLSCYGYHRETSPNIDNLAKEGVVFENVFSQSTWTRPSAASILTGAYPSVHGVKTVDDFLPESIITIPKIMKDNGLITIGVSSMGNFSSTFGFNQGFDHFLELYKEESLSEKRISIDTEKIMWKNHFHEDSVVIPTSEDINFFLKPILEKYVKKDLFICIWSLDTHDPYFVRDERIKKFSNNLKILFNKDIAKLKSKEDIAMLIDIYDDMIYYNDHFIGELINELVKLKIFDETMIIITSDHGEAFGEHNFNSHAGIPYDEQIKVPLIIKFPNSEYSGNKIKNIVQHIDVFPTLIDFLNITIESEFIQGKSILPLLSEGQEINNL